MVARLIAQSHAALTFTTAWLLLLHPDPHLFLSLQESVLQLIKGKGGEETGSLRLNRDGHSAAVSTPASLPRVLRTSKGWTTTGVQEP